MVRKRLIILQYQCILVKNKIERKGERERETDRETESDRETEGETEGERQRGRGGGKDGRREAEREGGERTDKKERVSRQPPFSHQSRFFCPISYATTLERNLTNFSIYISVCFSLLYCLALDKRIEGRRISAQ